MAGPVTTTLMAMSVMIFQDICSKSDVVVCVCSVMSHSATPWTVACQAPLLMGFSRQEYWSELPFPLPGDLPNARIKPTFPASPAL